MGRLGKIEPKAAPTGADVENRQSIRKIELGGDVPLLGGLSVLERHGLVLEIGAGILPVAVEEQVVEVPVEVVMVGGVALGTAGGIVVPDAALNEPQPLAQARQLRPGRIVEIPQQNLEEIIDRSLLDEERAVHIGFADGECGVEE